MHLRLLLPVGAGLLTLAVAPAAAVASVGIGVQAGPVQLAGDAHPGGTYALPPVYVVNTGTNPETVAIRIERISRGTGRTVPPVWVHVTAPLPRLGPGQSARVPLELVVPAHARPGRYVSDVIVTGSAALTAGGANLGVAAATDLVFRVTPGAVSQSWFSVPGWVLGATAGILALAAAAVLVRRSGIRVRIEREPAGADVTGQGPS